MVMQNLKVNKVHYGLCESGEYPGEIESNSYANCFLFPFFFFGGGGLNKMHHVQCESGE